MFHLRGRYLNRMPVQWEWRERKTLMPDFELDQSCSTTVRHFTLFPFALVNPQSPEAWLCSDSHFSLRESRAAPTTGKCRNASAPADHAYACCDGIYLARGACACNLRGTALPLLPRLLRLACQCTHCSCSSRDRRSSSRCFVWRLAPSALRRSSGVLHSLFLVAGEQRVPTRCVGRMVRRCRCSPQATRCTAAHHNLNQFAASWPDYDTPPAALHGKMR